MILPCIQSNTSCQYRALQNHFLHSSTLTLAKGYDIRVRNTHRAVQYLVIDIFMTSLIVFCLMFLHFVFIPLSQTSYLCVKHRVHVKWHYLIYGIGDDAIRGKNTMSWTLSYGTPSLRSKMLIISRKQLLQCFHAHFCRDFMKLDRFTSKI